MKEFNERDLFAALAMLGMKANTEYTGDSEEKIARWAYDLADAMLKEKENRDE